MFRKISILIIACSVQAKLLPSMAMNFNSNVFEKYNDVVPSDNIQYPVSSHYSRECALSFHLAYLTHFKAVNVITEGGIHLASQEQTLFRIFDPKSNDQHRNEAGDPYSVHVGKLTPLMYPSLYIGAGKDHWSAGVATEFRSYRFALGYYATLPIDADWELKPYIGPMIKADVTITPNISIGFTAKYLFGPSTLATDLPNHAVSTTEQYSPQDTATWETTWYNQLNKTSTTQATLGLTISYQPTS
ncbi:hypothetical protein OAT84_03055 [Gammaproteobacteria bacterium]|nr:hypothetical protein [Gammaproteobacteria bacterium]